MRFRRYMFTAALAVMFWFFWLGLMNYPLFPVVKASVEIASILAACLFLATLGGIWVVDAFEKWSAGTSQAIGTKPALTRMGIALTAAALFCVPFRVVMSSLLKSPYGYLDGLFTYGLVASGSVWLAAQVVDMLVHDRQSPPQRRR